MGAFQETKITKSHEGHDVNGTIVYSDDEKIEKKDNNEKEQKISGKKIQRFNTLSNDRSFSSGIKRNNNNYNNNNNKKNYNNNNNFMHNNININTNNNNNNYNYNINNNNNNYNYSQEEANKIYAKVNPDDLHKIVELMKKCDTRYQQGLEEFKNKNFIFAVELFKKSLNSYIALKKIIHDKPEIYPLEFRQLMDQKIDNKINLLNYTLNKTELIIEKMTVNNVKNLHRNMTHNDNNNNNNNNNINQFFNLMKNKNNNNNNLNNYNKNNNNNNNNKKSKNIHDKEDNQMESKIESEIMSTIPNVSFQDIVGMNYLKEMINEIIILPTIRPDLFTGILQPQRGILLFGPPGTGKTMIAKAIASECKSTFFNISASSLTSKWVGESEKTVRALFKIAYQKEPSIIFIDEIDSVLSKRSDNDNEAAKRLKTEFLIQFDGLGSDSKAKLLVIAATNRPMDLDDALLRRLPKRVYCAPLDEKGRAEFIKKTIDLVDNNLNENDVKLIAKKTEGYSNSDLKELCKEAAYEPVRELSCEEILKIDKFREINVKDMIKACGKIRGTLSQKVVKEIENWNNQFGGTD
jgi:SpoVK/Ycf46/Vps4 family AAA+-type ATPase